MLAHDTPPCDDGTVARMGHPTVCAGNGEKQIPPLRCGMTIKKTDKNNCNRRSFDYAQDDKVWVGGKIWGKDDGEVF